MRKKIHLNVYKIKGRALYFIYNDIHNPYEETYEGEYDTNDFYCLDKIIEKHYHTNKFLILSTTQDNCKTERVIEVCL